MAFRRRDLTDEVRDLDRAVDLCRGRIDDDVQRRAQAVTHHADQRLALSGGYTVVALAGATGSGKSSTFNALAGHEFAEPGIRRPTTSQALAAYWSDVPPTQFLDWLQVTRRVQVPERDAFDGLVLLDLPDHDSTEVSHQLEVDRLITMVDLMVWVVDPQKYADAALHDGYLRGLSSHSAVMTVVLNQIDRLTEEQRTSCIRDLRHVLDDEGLARTEILPVSTLTGEGMDRLRQHLAEAVSSRTAMANRLEADISRVAQQMRGQVGDGGATTVSGRQADELLDSLCLAGGVDVVVDAVTDATRRRGIAATGWPVVSWLVKLRPDPLRRLHLTAGSSSDRRRRRTTRAARKDIEPIDVQRTALPSRSGVASAKVDNALRAMSDDVSLGLPQGWAQSVRRATTAHRDDLADEVDRAIATTDLGMGEGLWWRQIIRVLQWLLIIMVVVGLGWLLVDLVLAYLQMPPLPAVRWHRFPMPTCLVVAGAACGVVVGLVSRAAVEVSARHRGHTVRARLVDSVEEVAERLVIAPVEDELHRRNEARGVLRKL